MRLILIVFLLVAFWVSGSARGAVIEDLFEASIAIADQSAASQRAAAQQGLRQILVKVSGSRDLLSDVQIKDKIRRASDFLRSFRYENIDGQLMYRAEFDQQSIERMIRVAGYPLWGSRRPDALMWIVQQDPVSFSRTFLSDSDDSGFKQSVSQTASERGIEVGFPLLDLSDLQQISVYDVWGSFVQNIEQASSRYESEFTVSARIYYVAESDQTDRAPLAPEAQVGWMADWVLIDGEQPEFGLFNGDSADSLATDLTNLLADRMAARYAINVQQMGESEAVEIVITNMNTLGQYVAVREFLVGLSVVNHAELVNQTGPNATFRLQLLGNQQDLFNTLRLDDKFQQEKDDFGRVIENQQYAWVP